jgi:hypothetical protein
VVYSLCCPSAFVLGLEIASASQYRTMESAFTDAEKVRHKSLFYPAPYCPLIKHSPRYRSTQRFVLAEMIKVSNMDVGTLVDFVKYHDIAPDWLEMQLPGGRF